MAEDERPERPIIAGLIVCPLLCIFAGLVLILFWIKLPTRWVLLGTGVLALAAGIAMIRSNITNGWGWHGQRWPND